MQTPTRAASNLIDSLVESVNLARIERKPFYHLELDKVFPSELYATMLAAMPNTADYRLVSGRARDFRPDGHPTRVKIDLFPDQVRHLSGELQVVWRLVGRALLSKELQLAFVKRLAPELEYRFRKQITDLNFYSVPTLTRDFPGYCLSEHPDTRSKGITVQFYLPRDNSTSQIGTVFYETKPDGNRERSKQMVFSPNTGYAFAVIPERSGFAVDRQTWHSVDMVSTDISQRHSLILTYFVDRGYQFGLNRMKRFGNCIKQTAQHYKVGRIPSALP